MKLNWNLPGGMGPCKTKNLPWGEYGYFLELHNDNLLWGAFKGSSLRSKPLLPIYVSLLTDSNILVPFSHTHSRNTAILFIANHL